MGSEWVLCTRAQHACCAQSSPSVRRFNGPDFISIVRHPSRSLQDEIWTIGSPDRHRGSCTAPTLLPKIPTSLKIQNADSSDGTQLNLHCIVYIISFLRNNKQLDRCKLYTYNCNKGQYCLSEIYVWKKAIPLLLHKKNNSMCCNTPVFPEAVDLLMGFRFQVHNRRVCAKKARQISPDSLLVWAQLRPLQNQSGV